MSYVDIILFFLAASLVLYTVLGGADFGAGIVELLIKPNKREDYIKVTKQALGPVWEANHMWMILAIVILFNGFPKLYSPLSVYLHLPLTLMLLGIIFRGCAFTFRHYDAVQDESGALYSWVFQISSLLTPLMLGMIAGAITQGEFVPADAGSYYDVYIAPWLSLFTLSLGLFMVALCGFLATVYLVGEVSQDQFAEVYRGISKKFAIAAVVLGFLVLVLGSSQGVPLTRVFLQSKISLYSMAIATVLIVYLYFLLRTESRIRIRILAAGVVSCILIGWFGMLFPNLVLYKGTQVTLDFYSHQAPEATLLYLTYALLGGSLFIFPSLFYLFRVFKGKA